MKYLTAVNTVLLGCLCLVGWLALHRQTQSPPGKAARTSPLAQYALGLAKMGKHGMARDLLLAAARKTTTQAEYWQSLASACDAFVAQSGASDADAILLRKELRTGLLTALATAESREQVQNLLPLYKKLASQPQPLKTTPESEGREEDGSRAIDMLHEGLGLSKQAPKDEELRDTLIELALDEQSIYPGLVPRIWPLIKDHVERMDADRDRVAALTIYLGSVTNAIRCCRSTELVEGLWEVKDEIEKERRKYMERWRSALDAELKDFLSEVKSSGLNALTSRGGHSEQPSPGEEPQQGPNKPNLLEEIETFESLATPLGMQLPGTVREIADAVSDAIKRDIQELEAALESQRQVLNTEKVAPARAADDGPPGTGRGPCQELLSRASTLMEDLSSSDVVFWLRRRRNTSDYASDPVESYAQQLLQCMQRISQVQTVAYNLWAARQIHGAGEVATWSDYLGVIDVGHLHPSVHALYSQVSDSRLNAEQDPRNRLTAISILLNKAKIPLTAF